MTKVWLALLAPRTKLFAVQATTATCQWVRHLVHLATIALKGQASQSYVQLVTIVGLLMTATAMPQMLVQLSHVNVLSATKSTLDP